MITSKEAIEELRKIEQQENNGAGDLWFYTLIEVISKDIEIIDILKKSIFNEERHTRRCHEPVGEKFYLISLSINENEEIKKVREWVLKNDRT